MDTFAREVTVKNVIFFPPFYAGSRIFPYRIDPFPEEAWCLEKQTEVPIVVSISKKMMENLLSVSIPPVCSLHFNCLFFDCIYISVTSEQTEKSCLR